MKKLLSILLSVVLAISLFTPVSADGYDNTIVLPSGDVITVTEYENGRIVVDYYSQNNHIEYDSFLDEVFDVDTHETLATTYEIVAGVNMLDPGMSNGTNQYVVDPTQGIYKQIHSTRYKHSSLAGCMPINQLTGQKGKRLSNLT